MAKSLSDRVAARGVRATLAAVVVLVGLASGQALAADAQVKIANFTFDPPTLTVKAGTTVTWVMPTTSRTWSWKKTVTSVQAR